MRERNGCEPCPQVKVTSCVVFEAARAFLLFLLSLWCQAPLGTLLTTVPSNFHLWQGHGRTSTLKHNVADDLRSINCDVTSISGMTKSCFFNLVDTLD